MKNIILAAFAALALAAAPARAGSQPQSYLDECYGKPLAVHVTGWTFDPDVSSQSIGIQVYLYTDSNCTTLYDNPTLTANVLRSDVNQAKGITGDHGFNADVPVAAAGDYWVKVFAIDATGDGNVQVGTTRSVTVAPGFPGSGTDADPYRISSVADWDVFAANISAGFGFDSRYRLEADIGPVTNMVGDSGHSFRGTFNGNGHSLTLAIESTDAWAAPFCYINGATISNLTVTGSVTGGGNHAAGLVGACGATGPNVIRDCTVAVNVVAAGTGYAGGIVGQGGDSTLSFEGCVFSGSVSGFTAFAGGLLGWGNTMTLNIANCLSTGAFTPSGAGQFHPIACKFANRTVTATVTNAYWINTVVPTAASGNLIPGAEGTPVSETLVPGKWTQPVTTPDGQTYYAWTAAPAGRLLAHYSFNDAGNAGTNLLRATVGRDAIVRATQTTPVAGPGEIAAVTDASVLSGLLAGDGAVAIPNGQHLAVPIPAPLLSGSGRPYTVVMKIRVPDNVGWRSLLNMPASNDTDAMVYLQQTTRNIYLKQFDKSSGAGIPASNGNVAADQWTTLTFAFGENATDVYRDSTHVMHAAGTLAGSYADCAAAGGYILVGADDSYDDDLFYLSDFRIYEGAVDAHSRVQLWAHGPLWAETNVGADEPWDCGLYFCWSDTVGYRRENRAWVASDGSTSNHSFDNSPTWGKDHATLLSEGWITEDGVLASAHDAANVKWGGDWRMPTDRELLDLINNCDWTSTTTNGMNGYVVRGRGDFADASIFLPAAGVVKDTIFYYPVGVGGGYWSSIPYNSRHAWYLYVGYNQTDGGLRDVFSAYSYSYYGMSVRPVQAPAGTVRILFDAHGDSVSLSSGSYMPGEAYGSLPIATRAGYTFAGWFTDADGGAQVTADSTVPASTTTLHAHWTEIIMPLPGSGTDADPYRISSVADWDVFAANVGVGVGFDANSRYRLEADIGPVTNTVGTQEHPFHGTFDGNGHTLTASLSGSDSFLAPFSAIVDATIRNLKVAGTVSGALHCSGLVGCIAKGTCVIENCEVAAAISTSSSHFGGFIGHSLMYAATLRGCVFSGSLSGGTYVATFHGWSNSGAATTLIDCLDASASDQPIGRGNDAACVSNTYYLTTKDFSNGERLWDIAKRGKRAYAVTGGEGVTIDFGTPSATYSVSGITAYSAGMVYRESGTPAASSGTFYAAEGKVVPLDLAATPPSGKILDAYVASAGTLSQSGNAWTLTMPAAAVVVSANWKTDGLTDLSTLTADYTAVDGEVLTGETAYTVTIPAGATVTLSNAVIEASGSSGITCLGDAVIVLEGSNTVTGDYDTYYGRGYPGIQAGPANTTLEICGGGSLTVEGGECAAGIGSDDAGACGDIVISGGTIAATGGYGAVGIGSGLDGECGDIVISGGTIAATGGYSASGIGSGWGGGCGDIVISGGTIAATGGGCASGIGGGSDGECGNIVISGGTIVATGKDYAVGIGCGDDEGVCGNIVISGGTVTATGGRAAVGIGSGNGSECGNITITDGVTILTSVNSGLGSNIGAGFLGTCGTVTVGGREMDEIAVSPYVYRPSDVPFAVSFDANGGSGSMAGQSFSSGIPQNLSSNGFMRAGRLFNGWNTRADGSGVYYYDGQPATFGFDTTLYAQWCGTDVTLTPETGFVALVDGQVLSGTGGTNTHVVVVPGATVTLSNVTINGSSVSEWAGITCLGDAVIVLEGLNTVNGGCDANDVYGRSGIQPGPADTTLVIRGPGSLTAEGAVDGSGIGGGLIIPCGDIVIQGGTITAIGNGNAAGIGSGKMGSCGDIVIQGGTITAIGNGGAAGIGSGEWGSCGDITIAGGVSFVSATCGERAINPIGAGVYGTCGIVTVAQRLLDAIAGDTRTITKPSVLNPEYTAQDGEVLTGEMAYTVTIPAGATVTLSNAVIEASGGPGITCLGNAVIVLEGSNTVTGDYDTYYGRGYSGIQAGPVNTTLEICGGGSLTVEGSEYAAGIGSSSGECGDIMISGGTIAATGGDYAAGIGSSSGECGDIMISGGTIAATGGDYAVGIGCGGEGYCGDIVISGGTVTATGGRDAGGIGGGSGSECGNITITDGVTLLTSVSSGLGSNIGAGFDGSCGAVTVGGMEMGEIAVSPYVYRPSSVQFAVSFDANGGNGSMAGQSFSSGIPQNLSSNGFTRAGCLFNGWNTRADGSGVYYYDGQPATFGSDTTLYAQWCDADVTLTPETGFVALVDGQVLSGTGGTNTHVVVVPGATVTLSNVTINGSKESRWAGLTCLGDAVIVLEGLNTVNGGYGAYDEYGPSGIQAGPANTTLAIRGPGSMTAEGAFEGSGIGGGWGIPCGDIVIQGGTISAIGNGYAAGIGSGKMGSCGDIVISGGAITAIGDGYAAGIGSGEWGSCGDITIADGVLFVSATCGEWGLNPIGAGGDGTCGTVTVAPGLTDETEDRTRRLSHSVTLTRESGEILLTNGQTLVGTGGANTHVFIADGATVMLRDCDLTEYAGYGANTPWAGITCLGDATIILEGDNAVKGFGAGYPGVFVPANKTLVISGTGRLMASANGDGAAGIDGAVTIGGTAYPDGIADESVLCGAIGTTRDWDDLAAGVGQVVRTTQRIRACLWLTSDDVVVSNMMGNASRPFYGTFDGCGYTLTLNLGAGGDGGGGGVIFMSVPPTPSIQYSFVAPFPVVNDATIKNVKVVGEVCGAEFAAGLVGYVEGGTNRIENCVVEASFRHILTCGGIVCAAGDVFDPESGPGSDGVSTTLAGCVFDGDIDPSCGFAGTLFGAGCDAVVDCLDLSDCDWTMFTDEFDIVISNTYYTATNKVALYGMEILGARATAKDAKPASIGEVRTDYGFVKAYASGLEYGGVYYVVEGAVLAENGMVVPGEWLAQYYPGQEDSYATIVNSTAANGRKVWACYVADLDPTDPDDDLVAGIDVSGGKVRVYILKGQSPNRYYRIWGSQTLDGRCSDVTDLADDLSHESYRFFFIQVSLHPLPEIGPK